MTTDEAASVPHLFPSLKPPCDMNEWPKWMQRFERYITASGLDKQSQEYLVNTFMYTIGDKAEAILNVLPLSEEE